MTVIPKERLQKRTEDQIAHMPVVMQHQVLMVPNAEKYRDEDEGNKSMNEAKNAEKYRDQDEGNKVKIEVKNLLENYCVAVRSTLGEKKLENVFEAGDEKEFVQDASGWLDKNRSSEKDEFAAKQEEQ